MQFIEALLTSLQNDYCIAPNRIFITGFSMGAWTTMNLACSHWRVFRAFAPFSGWGPGDMDAGHGSAPCCDDADAAASILITQGTTDDIVVLELCGELSRDFWIDRDGRTGTARPTSTTGCVSHEGCRSGLAVVYCTHGGNHMVWEFFSSFD